MPDRNLTLLAGTPWTKSRRVWFAIFSALGAIATIASLIAKLKPTVSIVAGILTAVCTAINQYFGFTASGPVVSRGEKPLPPRE